MEMIIEKLETDEEVYDMIEYDDTVESLEEDWTEVVIEAKNEDLRSSYELPVQVNKSTRKPYVARKQGGGRQMHQCQCGLVFSSNHRLKNHIRVKHEFVSESELLPCHLCSKK